MNTLDLPAAPRISAPRRIRARPSPGLHPLLWISGVLAGAILIFTVVLVAARLLAQDAVALEIAPAPADPFYQAKVDARVDELPAQF